MKNFKITQALLFASLLATAFVLVRGNVFAKASLIYMVWNLFLAWIPYIISLFIEEKTSKTTFVLLFIPWILFLPNAPYLVTDVLHVASRTSFPLWYDSLIFFFFGFIGLILGMVSLRRIHEYMKNHMNALFSELSIFFICLISSFGIYLGRFKRFNSWDVITNPEDLLRDSFNISTNLHQDMTALAFILTFTMATYLSYKIVCALMQK